MITFEPGALHALVLWRSTFGPTVGCKVLRDGAEDQYSVAECLADVVAGAAWRYDARVSIDSGPGQLRRVARLSGRLDKPGWDADSERPPVDEDFRALQATGRTAAQLRSLDPLDPVTPTPRIGSEGLRDAARQTVIAARQTLVLRLPEHGALIAALDQLDRLSR